MPEKILSRINRNKTIKLVFEKSEKFGKRWEKGFAILIPLAIFSLTIEVSETLFNIHLLGSQFRIVDVGRILMFFVITGFLLSAPYQLKKRKIRANFFGYLILALILLILISFALHPSLAGLRVLIKISFFVAFGISLLYLLEKKTIENIWKMFTLGGLLLSVVTIIQYITGFYFWYPAYDDSYLGGFRRINATFKDPNFFATFLIYTILFSITLFLTSKKDDPFKKVSLVALFLETIAIYLTFSRGAVFVLYLVLAIFLLTLWLTKQPKSKLIAVTLIFVITSVSLITFERNVRDRMLDVGRRIGSLASLNEEDLIVLNNPSSGGNGKSKLSARYKNQIEKIVYALPLNEGRKYLISSGIAMMIDNPFGVGVGNYRHALLSDYFDYIPKSVIRKSQDTPVSLSHTSFITLGAELGFLGIVWLTVFVVTLLMHLLRLLKSNLGLYDRFFALSILFSLFALIIHTQLRGALIDDTFFWILTFLFLHCLNWVYKGSANEGLSTRGSK